MKKMKLAVIGLALAGLCLASASVRAIEAGDVTHRYIANTNFTLTATTAINTNLYWVDTISLGNDEVIVNNGAMGGLLFFDNSGSVNPQDAASLGGAVTNTFTGGPTNKWLTSNYSLATKNGAYPIKAAQETTTGANIVPLSPTSLLGRVAGRVFFVCTNTTSTSFTVNLSIIKLGGK